MNIAFVTFASLFAADDCAIIWGEMESAKRLACQRMYLCGRFFNFREQKISPKSSTINEEVVV